MVQISFNRSLKTTREGIKRALADTLCPVCYHPVDGSKLHRAVLKKHSPLKDEANPKALENYYLVHEGCNK